MAAEVSKNYFNYVSASASLNGVSTVGSKKYVEQMALPRSVFDVPLALFWNLHPGSSPHLLQGGVGISCAFV